ncbi:MAG: KAP family NTPase [Chloroflexi bacterium]|nr:KAP family NTPase [Chloroflexota bacterium]
MSDRISYNFIPDEEIDLLEEGQDLLGTLPYVEILSNVIKTIAGTIEIEDKDNKGDDNKNNTTISLLGGWGSGKSSILRTLEKKFEKDTKSKIKVFNYDAWKYSRDSFRRTFLIELSKKFELSDKTELEKFYCDRHEEVDNKVTPNTKILWFCIPVYILMVITIISFYIMFPDSAYNIKTILTLIGTIVLPLITFVLGNLYIVYKTSVTKTKVFAPEQFEKFFNDTINAIKNKYKTEKIVIIIDNIDRCHGDIVIELLLAVKTFLGRKGVIFILPIDEDGIKKYLTSRIKFEKQEADEFLRKMFNINVVIKKFSDGELFDFASGLNKKYNLNITSEILSIVAQGFSKSPRRIIQFLNNFQAERLLAHEKEKKELIPKGSVTKNEPMLSRLAIIREEWPDVFSKR